LFYADKWKELFIRLKQEKTNGRGLVHSKFDPVKGGQNVAKRSDTCGPKGSNPMQKWAQKRANNVFFSVIRELLEGVCACDPHVSAAAGETWATRILWADLGHPPTSLLIQSGEV